MEYYVIDTTLNPPVDKRFSTYPRIVKYLEEMCGRSFGQSRKQRMVLLEEIGFGYDDNDSVNFVRSMSEKFNIGVIRDADRPGLKMRCDITSIALYQREEFGD